MMFFNTDYFNGNLGFGGIKPHIGFSIEACLGLFCVKTCATAVLSPD